MKNRGLEEFYNSRMDKYAFKYPISKGSAHIHNKKSLGFSSDFEKLYNEYGLKSTNHHNLLINEKCKQTIAQEFFDEYRTLFQREEERIISTEAFRRLQYKTQVMVNSISDDQRTRLLHSLEVEKISRKIALALGANCELTETIAIGHDIGHAPFGHAGEYAIRDYLKSNLAGSFSHAVQSVKVIDYLCSHRTLKPLGIRGLGVSKHVLEGILKHDTDSFCDDVTNPSYKLQYDCSNLSVPIGYTPSEKQKEIPILIGGIESQIVCWADKIAYLSHDWEEFVSIGYLEKMLNRVNTIVIQMIQMSNTTNRKYIENFPESCNIKEELKTINRIVKNIKKLNDIYNNKNDSNCSDNNDKNKEYYNAAKKFINRIIDDTSKRISKEIPNINSNTFESKENYYFSSEQYKTLHSFFEITKSWVIITNSYPEKIGNNMDAIFIFYNYLCKLLPHTTTPALIEKLIEGSKKKINNKTRNEVINLSNQNLVSVQNSKENIKKCFLINFKEIVFVAVGKVKEFIKIEYNRSTRIENMNCTAKQIITELFNFYSKNPCMLPLKQRSRIEQEFSIEESYEKESNEKNRIKSKLIDYYCFEINNASKDDKEKLADKLKDNIFSKTQINNDNIITNSLIDLKSKDEFIQKFDIKNSAVRKTIVLRVIADYIAGMTDRMAELKYNEIVSSSAQWSQEYTERATFSVY